MIDVGAYDLNKVSDQQRAIQDILFEHNSQYEQSGGLLGLPIAAYGVAAPTITALDRTNSNPINVVYHGLGYEPLFIAFQGTMAAGGISEMPVLDAFYNISDFQFVGHVKAYVDNANLWVIWNDQLQTGIQSITYIIFAVPLVGN